MKRLMHVAHTMRQLARTIVMTVVITTLLNVQLALGQIQDAHTQTLFDNNMFEHLESEYLWHHVNVLLFDAYQPIQPTQLDLKQQKWFTYYKIAELENNKSSAIFDLDKIVFSQSEFYLSEISSYHLAVYYFNQKQFDKALEYIKLTSPFSLDNAKWSELSFAKAYCLYQAKEYKKSYELFGKCHAFLKGSKKQFAQFYTGYLAYLFGEYDQAIKLLRNISSDTPFDKVGPLVIAQAYFQKKDYQQVVQNAQNIPISAQSDSHTLQAWNALVGYSAYITGNYEQTITYYEKLPLEKTKDDNLYPALYQYAYAYYEMNNYAEAQKHLEQLATVVPSQQSLYYESAFLLANVYLSRNEKEQARKMYAIVNPNMVEARKHYIASFTYAKLSLELGYTNEALAALEQLFRDRENPFPKEVADYLAQTLALSRNYIDSYEVMRSIKNPSTNLQKLAPSVNVHYSMWLVQNNDYQTADSLLTSTIHTPHITQRLLAESYFWLAEIKLAKSSYQSALTYLTKYEKTVAVRMLPAKRRKKLAYNKGYSLQKLGKYKSAIRSFQNVLPAWNGSRKKEEWEIDAFLFRTDCHLMLRHYAKAYADYRKLIKYPNKYSDYAYYQNCQIVGFQDTKIKERMINQFATYYPNSPYLQKALFDKTGILMNEKRYQEAISTLEAINQKTKGASVGLSKTDILLRLALAYYNTKSYHKADSLYKYIVISYPQTEGKDEAVRNLKTIAVEQGKTDQFYDFLTSIGYTVDKQLKDSLDFAVITNDILTKASEKKITKDIESYLYKHPKGNRAPEAYFILAEQYKKKKNWKKAARSYQSVIQFPENDYTNTSLYSLSKILFFELKDYEEAEKVFRTIVQISSNANEIKEALRGLLRIYYQDKNWGRASSTAQQLEGYPIYTSEDNDLTHIAYAKQFQLAKQYDAAILHYQDIKSNSYYYPEAQYEIGRMYWRMDSLEKAKKVALNITKLNTPNTFWYTRTYLLLGDIFIKQQDYFNAKATWGSIVSYAKDSTIKQQAREKLREIDILKEATLP